MLIFPRKHFKDHFTRDGPPGCIGAANPTGWMSKEIFLDFIKHFVKHVRCTKERPVLMLLDNHISHLGIDMLDFAKDNGVVLLSFPPHCSHKLQPLDRTVFGPFKKLIPASQSAWMKNNPGKTMTIYDLPAIVKTCWPQAATPTNITKGFEITGISPYNPHIFSETDFAPSSVTDRPQPQPAFETATLDNTIPNSAIVNSTTGASVNDPEGDPCHIAILPPSSSTGEVQIGYAAVAQITEPNETRLDKYLAAQGCKLHDVSGDGHCLLHAVIVSLKSQGVNMSPQQLTDKLCTEMTENGQFYKDFSCGDDMLADFTSYIQAKNYNTDTADFILNVLCNAIGVSAVVYLVQGRNIVTLYQQPRQPGLVSSGLCLKLALQGSRGNAHYSAVVCANYEVCCDSTEEHLQQEFSPEKIIPLPKASPRKQGIRKRKQRKSVVLTDTPVKRALEEEQNRQVKSSQKVIKHKNVSNKKGKGKKKTTQRRNKRNESESSNADTFCLVCVEPYTNSRPGEKWIQCTICKMWAHEECISDENQPFHVCQNCSSDDSDFDH